MSIDIRPGEPFGVLITPSKDDFKDIFQVDRSRLRALVDREHLVVLRGFDTFAQTQQFVDYCETWGKISVWPFGKVLEVREHDNPSDHIFDSSYVPLHWDGMYRPQVPEFQIFHCIEAPLNHQGGRTTFSNTKMVIENASEAQRQLWGRVTVNYERKMEFYHSKTVAPILAKHPYKDYSVIRYCEPTNKLDDSFINHPLIEFQRIDGEELSDLKQNLRRALYSPKNLYLHAWLPGDIVIADNHTLLHGREAFEKKASRHLRRVHVLGESAPRNPHLVFHS